MTSNDKTFIKVTNADIYKKLQDIEEHVVYTNGKVRMADLQLKGVWATFAILVGLIIWLIQNVQFR